MSNDKFPKAEAGRLAQAAERVLTSKAENIGPAMDALRKALTEYDNRIFAMVENPK